MLIGTKRKPYKPKKTYRKYCDDCGELFSPSGKYSKLCEKCKKKKEHTHMINK